MEGYILSLFILLLSFFSDFKHFVMIMDSVSQTFGQDTIKIDSFFSIVSETWTGEGVVLFLFFNCTVWLEGSQVPDQGLNPGYDSESVES